MAKPVFRLKRNDTSRSIRYYPRANPASDFTGATVVFNMSVADGGGAKIDRGSCTVASDSGGTYFEYDWTAADTDTAATYDAEFEATLASGEIETYPNDNYISVIIMKDLN